MRKLLFFLAPLITIGILVGCSGRLRQSKYSETEMLMGTFVQIKAASFEENEDQLRKTLEGAFHQARSIEKVLDIFNPSSQINSLNLEKEIIASPDLFDCLTTAVQISQDTSGEFDITVAPILNRDGFYSNMPEETRKNIPLGDEGVGWEKIKIFPDEKKITIPPETWLDASGIAKGFIVDKTYAYLRANGISEALVNAGGDIYCGSKAGDKFWIIGVRKPGEENIVLKLKLKNIAVATSGDYENVIIDEGTGEVVSHIIDPLDEEALPEKFSSMTVIASDCTTADAFATAMMAMGPERAIALADTIKGVDVIYVDVSGGKTHKRFSSGAGNYMMGGAEK